MTDGEATQSSEETVGPLQFGGHDEPGPDYNRRAPEPGQEAPEPRDTTERLPSEAPIISGQLAREIQDGKDNARAVNEGINDGRLTSMRPPWLREVASLDSATTYSDESDGPSGENDSTQESDSERYVRLKNKLESLDRQMDELDFGHAGRQPLAAEIEKIKAELEPLERKLLPRDRDMAEAESEIGRQHDQENGGAVGTSFTDRFTDQEPSAGDEPSGPVGDGNIDAAGNSTRQTHLGGGPIREDGRESTTGAMFKGSFLDGASFGERPVVNTLEDGKYKEIYTFDPEKFDQETERHVNSFIAWASQSPEHWPEERIAKSVRQDRARRAEERVWYEHYSGTIPKHWGEVEAGSPWHYISDDIRNPAVEFDEALTEAVIESPLPHIGRELSRYRKLTPEQLERLVSLGKLSFDDDKEKAASAQAKFGMDYGEARRRLDIYNLADRLREL